MDRATDRDGRTGFLNQRGLCIVLKAYFCITSEKIQIQKQFSLKSYFNNHSVNLPEKAKLLCQQFHLNPPNSLNALLIPFSGLLSYLFS